MIRSGGRNVAASPRARRWPRVLAAAFVAAALWTVAGAQLQLGPEWQVNTAITEGDQAYPAACRDEQGNLIVAWEGRGVDDSGNGVRMSGYGVDGIATFSSQVNEQTAGNQQLPAVACAPGGPFLVVWESNGQDGDDYGILGRRFDRPGVAQGGEFLINTQTADRQRAASACSGGDGNFVVVWQSYGQDGDGYGVFGQRFDAGGARLGDEFAVNTVTASSQARPAVACGADGDFVVVWESGAQDGDSYGVFGQRFAGDGAKAGAEFPVNTVTEGTQQLAAVAAASSGDFVVVWESYDGQDGDGYGIFGQRFASTGERQGTEFQVNTASAFNQQKPAIGMAPNGDFTVAWSSPHDGDGYGVFARRYDREGTPRAPEIPVNTFAAGDQGAISDEGHVLAVAGDASVIVWQSGGFIVPTQDGDGLGVFAQRFVPACAGDCGGDGAVSVADLITGVNILLDVQPVTTCAAVDTDAGGVVTVAELIVAVASALDGC